MANTSRRYINKQGQMLIPMNVDGGAWDEGFISAAKIAIIIVLGFVDLLLFSRINLLDSGWILKFLISLGIIWGNIIVIRYSVLEEGYYYKIYSKMKKYEVTTPAVFWNIANIKDTEDGAIMFYSDLSIGVLVKVESDTITGKTSDFRETHFDAISDFYRELNIRGYKFVQMNIMEQAGKDPRLHFLDELAVKVKNTNLASLIEVQVGYIKNITRATLFESDYFLVYTSDINKSNCIISDVSDCVYKLMDGGFIGFKILYSKDITELVKEIYGVKYFDYKDATLNMFRNSGFHFGNAFSVERIIFNTGEVVDVNEAEINRLYEISCCKNIGTSNNGRISIYDTLRGKIRNVVSGSSGSGSNGSMGENGSIMIKGKKFLKKVNNLGIHCDGTVDKNDGYKGNEFQQELNNNNINDCMNYSNEELIDF